jgi:hypothetical protein
MQKLPFIEEGKTENESIRIFNSDISKELLTWHRDREDRIVEALEENDWMYQEENKTPINIKNTIYIKKGVWHRVIKGKTDLKIKIKKIV